MGFFLNYNKYNLSERNMSDKFTERSINILLGTLSILEKHHEKMVTALTGINRSLEKIIAFEEEKRKVKSKEIPQPK